MLLSCLFVFFFFKQKTAYELRISDWSSDVCSSDLQRGDGAGEHASLEADLLGYARGEGIEHGAGMHAAIAGKRARKRSRRWVQRMVEASPRQIGRASCRERVCQYV